MYLVNQTWAFKVYADDVLRFYLRNEAYKSYSGNARQPNSLSLIKAKASFS